MRKISFNLIQIEQDKRVYEIILDGKKEGEFSIFYDGNDAVIDVDARRYKASGLYGVILLMEILYEALESKSFIKRAEFYLLDSDHVLDLYNDNFNVYVDGDKSDTLGKCYYIKKELNN